MTRSRLVRGLVLLALCAWGWVVYVLVKPYRTNVRTENAKAPIQDVVSYIAKSDSLFRDPFQSAHKRDPLSSSERRVVPILKALPVDSSEPPALSALLGGTPPMAILDSSGATRYVRVGERAFGWKLQSVDAGGVVVIKGRRRVVLR